MRALACLTSCASTTTPPMLTGSWRCGRSSIHDSPKRTAGRPVLYLALPGLHSPRCLWRSKPQRLLDEPRSCSLAMRDTPRLCGWRRLADELAHNANGEPVVGNWEPIVEPAKWLAVHAIILIRAIREARRLLCRQRASSCLCW